MAPRSEPPVNHIAADVQSAWHRFVEACEGVRPDLYRYCRSLTRNAWDAEDLVQDALSRAFVTLAGLFQQIESPRAWLFRVATNLWIDKQRRRSEEPLDEPEPADRWSRTLDSVDPAEVRDAGAMLIGRLSPQERTAVLLKDVFAFTLEEIAVMLATTPQAVKAALHRGRGKLADNDRPAPRPVDRSVLDAFCAAFNARDVDRLTQLLLESATAEIVGLATEYGVPKMLKPDTGSLHHSLFSPISHAVAPEWRDGDQGARATVEVAVHDGEPIVLAWYDDAIGPVVRDVVRFETKDGRITSIRYHFFSPDVIRDVCSDLGRDHRVNGYHWPFG